MISNPKKCGLNKSVKGGPRKCILSSLLMAIRHALFLNFYTFSVAEQRRHSKFEETSLQIDMEFTVDGLHIINESTILVQSTQTLVIVEVCKILLALSSD